MTPKPVPCACPRCRGVKSAHPKWGFDLKKVAGVLCMLCGRKIGRSRYRLDITLARFGSMSFYHVECPPVSPTRLKTCRNPRAPFGTSAAPRISRSARC